jgi:hypothetical protein
LCNPTFLYWHVAIFREYSILSWMLLCIIWKSKCLHETKKRASWDIDRMNASRKQKSTSLKQTWSCNIVNTAEIPIRVIFHHAPYYCLIVTNSPILGNNKRLKIVGKLNLGYKFKCNFLSFAETCRLTLSKYEHSGCKSSD